MTRADYPPRHVAIIPDGNGRWAKRRGLARLTGHRAGANNIHPVARVFANYGVKYLTIYTFSTENWNRPRIEIAGLLSILAGRIDKEAQVCHQENFRLMHLGKLDRLPQELRQKMEMAMTLTRNNTGLTLCLAFDYGGRDEIVQAAKRIINAALPDDQIDELLFGRYLQTGDIPDPDLIIRTGGEMRLSNFLLWQASYSELHFTPVLWPDFGQEDIERALLEYERRQRRFGNT